MKDRLSAADAGQMVTYVRAFAGGKQVVETRPQAPLVPPAPAQPAVIPPAPAATRPSPPAPVSAETAARTRVGTEMYRQYCLICHGIDGRGLEMKASMPTIPDFTNRSWQEGLSNPQLTVAILEGKGTLMPPFRGRVSDDQAADLTAYVRAFGPARAAPAVAPASDFEQRFRELEGQWNELQKQLQDLSKPPPKP
jgi:mono/diheme cytochrome c family protein